MKRLLLTAGILILILIGFVYVADQFSFEITPKNGNSFLSGLNDNQKSDKENVILATEENVVIDTVEKVGPSVVTILEELPQRQSGPQSFGPFQIFGFEDIPQEDIENEPQPIGSGFVVSDDGLIVSNKHVVSDRGAKYFVLTQDDKRFEVEKIYRDPLNDISILQINSNELKPVVMGDSSNLKVGQFVIAIGSALGEFRNSVTTGVISGLGRGITAGNAFQGMAEKLDNVIQTDAAINPGNSGGPLLNSSGQVIGVNTAVSAQGENIGFAIPINVIKESLDNFNKTGQFERAFLGVSYVVLTPDLAEVNDLPAGAYIDNIVSDSPADSAGLQRGDIIVEVNGKNIEKDKFELSQAISENKVGDKIKLRIWRDGELIEVEAELGLAPQE